MNHHPYYFPSDMDPDEKATFSMALAANAIAGPAFIGCGWTRRCGSDSYGGYVVSISKTSKGKPLIGLCDCYSECRSSWADGDMNCCLPNGAEDPKEVKPTKWITTYGKFKNGKPKWYFCDETGKRFIPGNHCFYRFGTCSEYRDPCF